MSRRLEPENPRPLPQGSWPRTGSDNRADQLDNWTPLERGHDHDHVDMRAPLPVLDHHGRHHTGATRRELADRIDAEIAAQHAREAAPLDDEGAVCLTHLADVVDGVCTARPHRPTGHELHES